MLLTEANFKIWYDEYLDQYRKTKKYVKARGGKVRDISPMSFRDFKTDFLGEHADFPKTSGKKLAQKMAKDELYEMSWKQAERVAEQYLKETGGKLSIAMISKVRMHADELWDAIRQRRAELKGEGERGKSIKQTIGQEFFGSD